MNRTICIDFDDTICDRGGNPIGQVSEVLTRLRGKGTRLIICSSRLDPGLWGDQLHFRVEELRSWLKEHGIPFDEITVHKPAADLYIDDKGYRFEGDWASAERAIHERLGL